MRVARWIGLSALVVGLLGCPSDEGEADGESSEGEGNAGEGSAGEGSAGEGSAGEGNAGEGSGSGDSGRAGSDNAEPVAGGDAAEAGAGGSGEGGGSGGSPAADAGEGAGAEHPCWPPCFAEAVADCTPMGACTFSFNEGDYVECYENGVGFCGVSGPPPTPAHGIVTRTDGSTLCLTGDIEYTGDSGTATYTNPDGELVATLTFATSGSTIVTIECGGESYEIDTSDPVCLFGSGGRTDVCETVDTPQCDCQ